MKATIEVPVERMVTLTMTESQAKTLASLAPNINCQVIHEFGGGNTIATKGAKLFEDISDALRSAAL